MVIAKMSGFKLMIVGANMVSAIENLYCKYLQQAGVDLCRFDAYNIFFDYYYTSPLHKILFKAGLSGIYQKINDRFVREVEEQRPDVIWVFKGMELFPGSLQRAKSKMIKLVNYNPDNPLVFTGKGSGNQYITDSISLYDLYLTYDRDIRYDLEKKHGVRAAILPFGFDNNEPLYQQCCRQQEIIKTCFLGNPDPQRAAFIKALAASGIAIDIYGNNWNKYVTHDHATLFPPVYGAEQWQVLHRYRAQLNLMRIHNENSHNMRSFEVPGIGGIMVAPDTADHRLYFKEGEEVFLFKGVQDCAAQINKLLAMNAADAARIRLAARNRSVTSGYTYEARANQALQLIGSLFNG